MWASIRWNSVALVILIFRLSRRSSGIVSHLSFKNKKMWPKDAELKLVELMSYIWDFLNSSSHMQG